MSKEYSYERTTCKKKELISVFIMFLSFLIVYLYPALAYISRLSNVFSSFKLIPLPGE